MSDIQHTSKESSKGQLTQEKQPDPSSLITKDSGKEHHRHRRCHRHHHHHRRRRDETKRQMTCKGEDKYANDSSKIMPNALELHFDQLVKTNAANEHCRRAIDGSLDEVSEVSCLERGQVKKIPSSTTLVPPEPRSATTTPGIAAQHARRIESPTGEVTTLPDSELQPEKYDAAQHHYKHREKSLHHGQKREGVHASTESRKHHGHHHRSGHKHRHRKQDHCKMVKPSLSSVYGTLSEEASIATTSRKHDHHHHSGQKHSRQKQDHHKMLNATVCDETSILSTNEPRKGQKEHVDSGYGDESGNHPEIQHDSTHAKGSDYLRVQHEKTVTRPQASKWSRREIDETLDELKDHNDRSKQQNSKKNPQLELVPALSVPTLPSDIPCQTEHKAHARRSDERDARGKSLPALAPALPPPNCNDSPSSLPIPNMELPLPASGEAVNATAISRPGAFHVSGARHRAAHLNHANDVACESTRMEQEQPQMHQSQAEDLVMAELVEETQLVIGTPARPRRTVIALIAALLVTIAVAVTVVLVTTTNGEDTDNEEPSHNPPEPSSWAQLGPDLVGIRNIDLFGYSVALSPDGSVLAVGAPKNNDDGQYSGQVRVFLRSSDNSSWTPLGQPIQGSHANDEVGASVALSSNGSVLVVGAPQWLKSDGNRTGYARAYNLVTDVDTTKWVQVGQDLLGGANGDKFGWTVALSVDGNTVAVGAFANNDGGFQAGHVKAFRIDTGKRQWMQLGQTVEGTVDDALGGSVSLSGHGNTLAIGADQWESGGLPGYAKVFELSGGDSWSQVGQTLVGTASDDRFGNALSLSLDGAIIAVGAWSKDANGANAGHVQVFELQKGGPQWVQIGQDIAGKDENDEFGRGVSLSANGRVVAIGAQQCCGLPGYARVYGLVGGNWTQYGQDLVGEGPGDKFGWRLSLSADGQVLVIGGYGNDGNTGLVRVYKMQPDGKRWIRQRRKM